jgi:hypothetical protein
VGPRAGLDTDARGNILPPLPGLEPRSSGLPARSHSLTLFNLSSYLNYYSPSISSDYENRELFSLFLPFSLCGNSDIVIHINNISKTSFATVEHIKNVLRDRNSFIIHFVCHSIRGGSRIRELRRNTFALQPISLCCHLIQG